mgnify:CR=1 FL=1
MVPFDVRYHGHHSPFGTSFMPQFSRALCTVAAITFSSLASAPAVHAQRTTLPDVKIRWDRMCQIRKEKFDHILPEAMRDEVAARVGAMKRDHLRSAMPPARRRSRANSPTARSIR